MKGIKGQLSSLSITDLLQWIDMNKKSGVLFVSSDTAEKCFCFETGRLLMAGAKDNEQRFGNFLSREAMVPVEKLREAVKAGRREGKSLVSHLIDSKLVPAEFIKVSIEQLAERVILEILGWEEGSFQFVEELPPLLARSPVKLGVNFITFEAVRKHDERLKQQGVG